MLIKIKNRLILTATIITAISLTACSSTALITESSIESRVETAESVTSATTATKEQTAEFYLQNDGIYFVSDDIRKRLREYIPFCEWNDREFEIGLQTFMKNYCSEALSVDDIFIIAEEWCKNIESQREQLQQEYQAQQTAQASNLMTDNTTSNVQNNSEAANTDKEFKKGTLHIVKLPMDAVVYPGEIMCSELLKNEILSALSNSGLSSNNFEVIKNKYYEATLDKDNTIVHTDIVNKLVNNLKSELGKINNNNTGTNSGSSNIEVDDNGYVYENNNEYPSGDISGSDDTPRLDDPTAGLDTNVDIEAIIRENNANAGDGGERIDDPDLIIGDGSGNYSNGN